MKYKNWVLVLLINLCIVATLGLLMRYKIIFSFPFLEQKHIQHAHSHFAFIAWVSQALYLLLIHFIDKKTEINHKIYHRILLLNTGLSVGMLVSFLFKGYHLSSNLFSFLIVLNSLYFTFHFIRDAKKIKEHDLIKKWFYAALFFNFIAYLGTFYLAYMMINKIYHQEMQLASVYFYLHFQYNGWFIFACLGLMLYQATKHITIPHQQKIFWIFFLSTIPNYFLSILWFKIPPVLYVLVILSAISQVLVWIYIAFYLWKLKELWSRTTDLFYKWIVAILFISFSIKLVLQLFSTIPYVSHLAYSLRPIVIAYLHLVLLVIITMFLLQYIYKYILEIKISRPLMLFFISVLINEILLGLQGFAGIFMLNIAYIHYYLLVASIAIFLSLIATVFRLRSL